MNQEHPFPPRQEPIGSGEWATGTFAARMRQWRDGVKASYGSEGWAAILTHAAQARSRMEFVRSRFKAPWYGIVLSREKRKGCEDLCTVRVLRDRRGNWVRKPWVRQISAHWLAPCEPWFDPDAPYNTSIPVAVMDERRGKAKETLRLRAERKKMRRQLRGFE